LLSLAEAIGQVRPRHTPDSAINLLPTGTFKEWCDVESDQCCPTWGYTCTVPYLLFISWCSPTSMDYRIQIFCAHFGCLASLIPLLV